MWDFTCAKVIHLTEYSFLIFSSINLIVIHTLKDNADKEENCKILHSN